MCLRHAPCLHPIRSLWNPEACGPCTELLAACALKDSPGAPDARRVVKEILRGAEAAATRRGLDGFVSAEVFTTRFEPWMGSLYDKRAIRSDPEKSSPRPPRPAFSPARTSRDSPPPSPPRKTIPQERSSSSKEAPVSRVPPASRVPSPSPSRHSKRPPSRSPTDRSQKARKRELSPDTIQTTIRQLLALQQSQAGSPARRSRSRERRPRSLSASPDRSLARHYRSRSSSSSSGTDNRSPSPHRREPFGTESDSSRPASPAPQEVVTLPGRSPSPPHRTTEEEDIEGTSFYLLTPEASIRSGNLHLPNLPPVLAANLILKKEQDKQAVAFRDPTLEPALDYIERLPRVGMKKDSTPSQRELVYNLNKVVHASGHHVPGMSWTVKHTQTQDSPFQVAESPQLESLAHRWRQPKGFGDESRKLPTSPNVPICSSGENVQGLLDFLEAPPLSPTSHKISKVYTDRRTTCEPHKADRDLDSEYRRAGRTATALKMAWEFMEEVADLDDLKPLARLKILRSVLKAFKRDMNANLDYQVTRAVHHRRNMIQFSTREMPQEDIRLAIQDLPLPRGPTLFHESAAEKVAETLLRPEGRQLKAIPPKPFRPPTTSRPASQHRPAPTSNPKHSQHTNASGRQSTRPSHPKAPPPRRNASASSAPSKRKSAPWEASKKSSSSTSKPRHPATKEASSSSKR